MDYNQYNHCIQILRTKPKFFQRDNIEEKLRCLALFRDKGGPIVISSLMSLLNEQNELLRYKIADTVIHLFKKLKSQHDLYDSLKYLDIKEEDIEMYKRQFPQEQTVFLLGIASFNRNGYVREKAVEGLAATGRPEAIPYILLRLGDWVQPIRETAGKAIQTFFQEDYIEPLLQQLPMVDNLSRVGRVDLSGIRDDIYEFVLSQKLTDDLYKRIKKISDKARLAYVRQYLQKKGIDPLILHFFQADKSFLIRIELANQVQNLNKEEQISLLDKLLADQSAKVRLAALYQIPLIDKFLPMILDLACDGSASVRYLSRYLLKEQHIDFAAFYRQRIQEERMLSGSILGLSEVGTKEDLAVFQTHISDSDKAVQLACIRAIAGIDTVLAKSYCLERINHPSRVVRDKCMRILSTSCDNETIEKVRLLYITGTFQQKKTALSFLSKVGGWRVLSDLFQSITDEHEDIQSMGWNLLQRWKDRSVRLFSAPSATDLERARRIYKQVDAEKISMSYRRKLWDELALFLRS